MDISKAVLKLDEKRLRTLLDSVNTSDLEPDWINYLDDNGNSVLHNMLLTIPVHELMQAPQRRHIVYMLRNAGLDINLQEEHGDTALHLVIREVHGDPELCEALLQSGADIHLKNMDGHSSADLVASSSSLPKVTKELFEKYSPGLWTAVASDDIMGVRKLINLWVRVDLAKGCRTLKELALDKGTENIIRLIKDIEPSMRLAHGVLASDVKAVTELCQSDRPINTEFKNLGDMGATPLFYAIMQNNLDLVRALCQKRAKTDTTITFEDEDIPIYFTALNQETDPEIIKLLTPSRAENSQLISMRYKGKHVLLHCVDNDVSPSAVKYILQQGFPELVALRSLSNLCSKEVAEMKNKHQYVKVIEEVVHDWCLDSDSKHRKTLALLGYGYLKEAQKDGLPVSEIVHSMETSSSQAKFYTRLDKYQEHIGRLHEAIDAGKAQLVRSLLKYSGEDAQCFHTNLVQSRTKSDGQPTLHRAVLRRHSYIIQLLCQSIAKIPGLKLDELRDTHHRTALHYAYGMQDAKDIINTLLDYGASEWAMDKDGRSPLVFKDFKDTSVMREFLQYHRQQDFQSAEPEPWKCSRPPIQFAGCQHHGRVTGAHSHPPPLAARGWTQGGRAGQHLPPQYQQQQQQQQGGVCGQNSGHTHQTGPSAQNMNAGYSCVLL